MAGSSRGAHGGGGGGWSRALTDIAMAKDPVPEKIPSGTVLVGHDEHTITIKDKWAKATFHLLVLPRIPFHLSQAHGKHRDGSSKDQSEPPKLALAGGKLQGGSSSGSTVPSSHLKDISALIASPYAAEVLEALRRASEKAIEYIHGQMMALSVPGSEDTSKAIWGIERAFHAIPSMETVHLHVYSSELVSPALKNAKHYNSFLPGHGFALPLDEIEALVTAGKKTLPHPTSHYEKLLKAPLVGRDGRPYRNIPLLKAHLDAHWRAEIRGGTKAAGSAKKKKNERQEDDEAGLEQHSPKRPRTSGSKV